jgi:small subunit ribosomal protein S14
LRILPNFTKIHDVATLGLQAAAHPVTPAPRIMAKKSWIARNARKKVTVEKYAELRLKLKAAKDYVGLSMLPRDASPTRLVNRCEITGRRRAFLRRFRLSRITFRELASAGMLPGVTKSSW